MASKSKTINWGGNDLIVNRVITGADTRAKGNITLPDTLSAGHLASRQTVVSHTTGNLTLTAADTGKLYLLNKADGAVITLPALSAANVGIWYEFIANTSVTSNAYDFVTGTQGTDFFIGTVAMLNNTDSEEVVLATANGSTHDNFTMAGTTTGGLAGTQFKLRAISATLWQVSGYLVSSGASSTPFATT